MVSAWREPPGVMSVDPSAGARCGVQGTFAIVGFIETPPPFLEACGRLQAAVTESKRGAGEQCSPAVTRLHVVSGPPRSEVEHHALTAFAPSRFGHCRNWPWRVCPAMRLRGVGSSCNSADDHCRLNSTGALTCSGLCGTAHNDLSKLTGLWTSLLGPFLFRFCFVTTASSCVLFVL
jgi:hypothetical protein